MDYFTSGAGVISASVEAQGFVPRLSLVDARGNVLAQSDSGTLTGVSDGTDYLKVEAADGGVTSAAAMSCDKAAGLKTPAT